VPEPSAFEVEMATEKLQKRHKTPGTGQIPAELIKAGEQFSPRSIKLIHIFRNWSNCQRNGRIQSLCLFKRRAIKQTVVIFE
jgi:fatty acid-binding protein DegV